MPLNKVDSSALTQSHLVDPYKPRRADDQAQAGAKDVSSHQPAPAMGDHAEISSDAHKLVDLRQAVDAGRAALEGLDEVRPDKIAQVKERLSAGFYQSAEVRDRVASRLSNMFLEGSLF